MLRKLEKRSHSNRIGTCFLVRVQGEMFDKTCHGMDFFSLKLQNRPKHVWTLMFCYFLILVMMTWLLFWRFHVLPQAADVVPGLLLGTPGISRERLPRSSLGPQVCSRQRLQSGWQMGLERSFSGCPRWIEQEWDLMMIHDSENLWWKQEWNGRL